MAVATMREETPAVRERAPSAAGHGAHSENLEPAPRERDEIRPPPAAFVAIERHRRAGVGCEERIAHFFADFEMLARYRGA